MVQEFHVLSCYACKMFQVHQVKKSTNKWTCKVCGEKQSIKNIFFEGNAKECRQHVQKFNGRVGVSRFENSLSKINETEGYGSWDGDYGAVGDYNELSLASDLLDLMDEESNTVKSKWDRFIEKSIDDVDDDNENDTRHRPTVPSSASYQGQGSKKGMKRNSEGISKTSSKTHDSFKNTIPVNKHSGEQLCGLNKDSNVQYDISSHTHTISKQTVVGISKTSSKTHDSFKNTIPVNKHSDEQLCGLNKDSNVQYDITPHTHTISKQTVVSSSWKKSSLVSDTSKANISNKWNKYVVSSNSDLAISTTEHETKNQDKIRRLPELNSLDKTSIRRNPFDKSSVQRHPSESRDQTNVQRNSSTSKWSRFVEVDIFDFDDEA